MSSQVVLYDLPSQQGTSWSLNPWKTRMILNFKGIDYKTEWIEYPDLAPTLKSFGLPPNDKNAPGYFADYSSPAIRYPDGTYGMDSWLIAQELEKRYPSPSLHFHNPIAVQAQGHVDKLKEALILHLIPKVPSLLNKPSADYYYETREKSFGAPLQEVERKSATEECWENAKGPAKEAGDLLRQNGGPFFSGESVSYADFIFVSFLHCMRRVSSDLFERTLALDSAFPKVYEASKQWLEKDT
ncbi:Nn.00g020800.m01.CDS01 [Neocucurbitaria sp. VM-36]